MHDHHLSDQELEAYLAGRVPPGARERIEAHLVRCDECLDATLALWRIVQGDQSGPPVP